MRKVWKALATTFHEWKAREAPRMGAAVAFYSVLSFAPLLILVISLGSLLFGSGGAQREMVEQFQRLIGPEGARVVAGVLRHAHEPATGMLAGIVGIAVLLFGASGVFVQLRDALNDLWEVDPRERPQGLVGLFKDRFLSFGMVLAIGFLLLVSLALSAALEASGRSLSNLGGFPPVVWEILNTLAALGVVTALFAAIFRFVPDIRLPWRGIWRGAALTAVLVTVGKALIGVYLGRAGVGSAYGAAGSLVVLVIWIYYSAQIFFFGATFTRVHAHARGLWPESRGSVRG
jgi:membrane protein